MQQSSNATKGELDKRLARGGHPAYGGRSWIAVATGFVGRLPLPALVCYILAGILAVGLFALNDWLAFRAPHLAFEPFHLTLALEAIYAVALMHFLDERAGRALQHMRPLLMPPEAFETLRRQLTELPPRPTLLASLVGAALGFSAVVIERTALPAVFRPYIPGPDGRWFVEAWLILTWFIFGGLFFHTWHQLRTINRIYMRYTMVDMDYYQPLFHFSRVSAMTAVGLAMIPYAWFLAVPNLIREPMGLAFGALFPLFALAAFLWPLIGIHNLMVEAKGRATLEHAKVLKEVRESLFGHVAAGTLAELSDLPDTLQALRGEREALQHVPTWPWQPGTPRSVAAALLLPLIVWFLQWVLEKILAG